MKLVVTSDHKAKFLAACRDALGGHGNIQFGYENTEFTTGTVDLTVEHVAVKPKRSIADVIDEVTL
jgi:hypothetical protein